MKSSVLVLVSTWLISVSVEGNSCRCGINRYTTKIVNGKPSKKAAHPWLVKFKNFEIYPHKIVPKECGATFINSEWLLTAAHCFEEGDAGQMPSTIGRYIQFGDNDVSSFQGSRVFIVDKAGSVQDKRDLHNVRRVDRIIPHPDYDSVSIVNDIALLHISEPVKFDSYVTPICLPQKDLGPYSNLVVAGWGMTGDNDPTSDILLEVSIQEANTCWFLNKTHQICAKKGNMGTCSGDSGGPLMTTRQGRVYQVGVVSYGPFSCHDTDADIYAKVNAYYAWIKKHATTGEWCN